ncbi:MAG TPA: DUF5723 family protein [Spirochaetota bacterium]|nr:MAG: hypothetical protein BWX91_01408 [Spirochaetes bacterium ADurb.Bin133]HNZ25732.1 DUF5723 family protein [Spirochaetota bacterium]HPY87209.1 DUF5723 family protein [Spirochaetota bacterium]
MKYKVLFLLSAIMCASNLQSISFITTAESISGNGAFASVSEGFESMLYNPAGLFSTPKKFGINVLGSYGVRYFNNTFSTDDILNIFSIGDVTEIFKKKSEDMNSYNTNFDMGFDLSLFNIFAYKKLKTFSFGFSIQLKSSFTVTLGKELFSAFTNKLDLTNSLFFNVSSTFSQYLDLTYSISTRAKFLEKYIKIFDEIHVGATGHLYLPTIFLNMQGTGEIYHKDPNPLSDDFIRNVYPFGIKIASNISSSGLVQNALGSFGYVLDGMERDEKMSNIAKLLKPLLFNGKVGGFGLGIDMGFSFVFLKKFTAGFAITDLGFITFPKSAAGEINFDFDMTKLFSSDSSSDNENYNINDDISSNVYLNENGITWMTNLTIRTGIVWEPFDNKYFEFLLALDLSLSDFNRLLNPGEYITFNLSTGVEFTPKVGIVKFPLRSAFSYNTQANVPSFSMGMGLYVGPVEMEIGIKGLEALILEWGAKEIQIGLDFKFEFD